MSKKSLIIGGAGFIGFHLAKSLSDQGQEVRILDNFARGREDDELNKLIGRENVNFIKGDITKKDVFESLPEDLDYIYHLAAINGTENFYNAPDKVLKVGALGMFNILDWFVKRKKGKLLFSSSSEAYAGALKMMGDNFPIPTPEEVPLVVEDPKNLRWSYGGSKIISEIIMHSYAKVHNTDNFAIVRYHNIYGPRMGFEHVVPQFIEKIVKRRVPFKILGGQETRSFCYVDDGIRATQKVMESEKTNGQTIHIGRSDDEIKIVDMAKILFEIAGIVPTFDIGSAPKGCVKRRCPDTTKLHSLGFSPEVGLKDGLKLCFDWYKNKFPS